MKRNLHLSSLFWGDLKSLWNSLFKDSCKQTIGEIFNVISGWLLDSLQELLYTKKWHVLQMKKMEKVMSEYVIHDFVYKLHEFPDPSNQKLIQHRIIGDYFVCSPPLRAFLHAYLFAPHVYLIPWWTLIMNNEELDLRIRLAHCVVAVLTAEMLKKRMTIKTKDIMQFLK